MSKNIADAAYSFHEQFPNKLKFISGKWFDENNDEIRNINSVLFNFTHDENPKLSYIFNFHKSPSDLENFKQEFIFGYGSSDLWPEQRIARLGREYKGPLNNYDLTFEQYLIIGVMLYLPLEECFFICTGVGGSGKSTFGNLVKQLFMNDVSCTSLDELSGFKLAEAVKCRLIYSEEISSNAINCSALKELSSKQEITVEPKFVTPYDVKSQSSLLFNCNRPPKVDISDSGILRRVIFYCRNKKIENPDVTLRSKKYTEEDLINIAANAYKRINETPDWRNYFREDTFNTIVKENTVYKAYKCGFLTYQGYKTYCNQEDIKTICSEGKWEAIMEYIKEYEDDTGRIIQDDDLPF